MIEGDKEMSVVSFDDWRKKKEQASALTSRGALRADVSQKEAYGFDLCVYISEESAQSHPNAQELESLWAELRSLILELPKEHGYFYFVAFDAFFHDDAETFYSSFSQFLESEERLFTEIPECDWWIDNFFWVFTPALPGMYGRCSELFHQYWPGSAMGWVCAALELNETADASSDLELDLLHLALEDDSDCFLAQYLIASVFYEQSLWKSALHYFELAAFSRMYREDAAFYFDYAWAAEKARRNSVAIDAYKNCIALDESYSSALNNLGCVYMRQEDYREAERCFRRAIELNLDDLLPYRNMVTVLERSGRRKECIAFIRAHLDVLGQQYEMALELFESASEDEILISFPEVPLTNDAALYKQLMEELIEQRINNGESCFGRRLEMVEDGGGYGRSYFLPDAGRVDILARNSNEAQELLVIHVCGSQATEKNLLFLWQQINALQNQPRAFDKITGILLARDLDKDLRSRSKQFSLGNVELYTLESEFKRAK